MNQRNSLSFSLLCVLLLAVSMGQVDAQSTAQDKLAALFGNDVIAKGEGFEIKQSALDESVVTIRASAAGRGNDISPAATGRLEREVLRRLINIKLLMARATDADRTDGKEKADERIALLTERAGSEQAMERQLKAVGLTLDRLRAKLTEEATSEVVLQRELNITITDAEVKAYYDDNPARFEKPEMVRAAHILKTTVDPATGEELSPDGKEAKRRRIDALLKRARQGEDFAKLAEESSEDPGSKANGGEYTFPRGRMAPKFEAAAFALAPGQISDVITTKFGYHIIKVYERIPATTVELDEKVTDEVRAFLNSQKLSEQMEPFMKTLTAEANVQILVERLKPQPGDNPAPDEE